MNINLSIYGHGTNEVYKCIIYDFMKYLSMNASMTIKNPFVHALEILDLGVIVGGEMVGIN